MQLLTKHPIHVRLESFRCVSQPTRHDLEFKVPIMALKSCLVNVLLSFGFCLEFVNLIKACTDRPQIVPLVNGIPTKVFKDTRGLHQGCSMSPFLYILMAKILSRKLSIEKEVGYIPGIKIVRGVVPINHALFADDSLLLGGASLNIARAFNVILQKYYLITGALINNNKKRCLWLECRSIKNYLNI